jgi:hypothetical protein
LCFFHFLQQSSSSFGKCLCCRLGN